jgi:hypothetical protein
MPKAVYMHQQPNTDAAPQRPPIDKSQIEHFLRMLLRGSKWATIQTFTDKEPKPNPDPFAKVFNVNRITQAVLEKYEQGAGV